MNITKIDKIFVSLVIIALIVFSSEYVFMDKHSLKTRQRRYENLLMLASSNGDIKQKAASVYAGQKDGIYSPSLQLIAITITLIMFGVWLSFFIAQSMGLTEKALRVKDWNTTIMAGCIFVVWLIILDIGVFLFFLWEH